MSTISPIHQGTIAAKPFAHPDHGRIGGNHDHGRIGGNHDHGRIGGDQNRGPISGDHDRGRIGGTHDHHSGGLRGKTGSGGKLGGDDLGESPANDARAEIGNLLTSLSSLSTQAQGLPLTPPTLPGLPQSQGYQMQPADYAFGDDAN
jgi:hypothetical protein